MVVKTELPERRLKTIREQIAHMLAGLFFKQVPPPSSVELRESFVLWSLDLKSFEECPPKDGNLAAVVTDYWHHQILFDKEPTAHARSKVPRGRPARVLKVSISPLAKKIDDAIDWIESPEREWAKSELVNVRLLMLPSFLIRAFWLVEPRKVYVIRVFPGFVNLQPGQLLDENDFLTALYTDLKLQRKDRNLKK